MNVLSFRETLHAADCFVGTIFLTKEGDVPTHQSFWTVVIPHSSPSFKASISLYFRDLFKQIYAHDRWLKK